MAWANFSIFGLIFLIGTVSAIKHPRILGGDDAKIQSFPYQVSLRHSGKHFCSGAILSSVHILTAAHCVNFYWNKNEITVHSGTSRTDQRGKMHKVHKVHIHPEWKEDEKNGYPNDIAVVTLNNPVAFDDYQQTIHLPDSDVLEFQKAYLAGWGSTSNSHNIAPHILQQIKMEVLPSNRCKPLISHKISEKQFCAYRSFGVGVCHGDDGGPLVSKGKVIGIVSFKDSVLCGAGKPDIYTNVFAYKDFIESVMNG